MRKLRLTKYTDIGLSLRKPCSVKRRVVKKSSSTKFHEKGIVLDERVGGWMGGLIDGLMDLKVILRFF
jgi:hypothetical protein